MNRPLVKKGISGLRGYLYLVQITNGTNSQPIEKLNTYKAAAIAITVAIAYNPGLLINSEKPAVPTGKVTCNIKKSAGNTGTTR
jgi:hypothetical protein